MRQLRAPTVLLLLLVAAGCASLGGSDPLIVRSEDLLTNSLSVYATAITWHDTPGNSKTESKEVYKALEQVRVRFPSAWQALKDGVATYKRTKDKSTLEALIEALKTILRTIPPVANGGKAWTG